MTRYRENPDGTENQEATADNDRAVFAAKMQHKAEQELELAKRLEAQRKARKRAGRRPE